MLDRSCIRTYCDVPKRERKRVITFRHSMWDAPSIIDTMTYDARKCIDSQAGRWPGLDLAPHANATCVSRTHWEAIRREAERIGWPQIHKRDLYVHDRNLLNRVPFDVPFLWVACDSSTHLYHVDVVDGTGKGVTHMAESIPEIFGRDRCRLYVWDGAYLREHATPESASDALQSLRNAWMKAHAPSR